ncbi:hypothetical protein XBLMG947_1331 [Xanthomonas bromi]|uniref:Uncharacterized protein n=1 Tax=Xanthomonas bromi TaxID=56449 RepID=A0A1C3NJL4_9XANT|nr:hypothetical protein XBLMG947_1331 [Xanthomonas bromi]
MPQRSLLGVQAFDLPRQAPQVQQRQADQAATTGTDQHRAEDVASSDQLQHAYPDQEQDHQDHDQDLGRLSRMQPLCGQMVVQTEGGAGYARYVLVLGLMRSVTPARYAPSINSIHAASAAASCCAVASRSRPSTAILSLSA